MHRDNADESANERTIGCALNEPDGRSDPSADTEPYAGTDASDVCSNGGSKCCAVARSNHSAKYSSVIRADSSSDTDSYDGADASDSCTNGGTKCCSDGRAVSGSDSCTEHSADFSAI